jgi:hypothetical protein
MLIHIVGVMEDIGASMRQDREAKEGGLAPKRERGGLIAATTPMLRACHP